MFSGFLKSIIIWWHEDEYCETQMIDYLEETKVFFENIKKLDFFLLEVKKEKNSYNIS